MLRADNEELERFGSDSFRKVVEAKTVTVLRDGRETVISIPEDMMQRCMRDGKGFADPLRIPMGVRELPDKNAPAALAGMQPKDSVVAINGVATPTFYDASGVLSENKGEEVTVDFYRNGQLESLTMRTDSAGKIGVAVMLPTDLYQTVTRKYGFFESLPAGIKLGINTLKGYVNDNMCLRRKAPPVWAVSVRSAECSRLCGIGGFSGNVRLFYLSSWRS